MSDRAERRRLDRRPLTRTSAADRWLIRLLTLLVWPIAAVAWLVIGLFSVRELGRVLRRTGQNLETYDW